MVHPPLRSSAGVPAVEHMRQVAHATVMRACGFGSLAIFCFMVGLSYTPPLAFKVGGAFTLLMTGVLLLKSVEARWKPYRRTEMWLYLNESTRPPESTAQQLTSSILRETYLTFALWTSFIAMVMCALALLFGLLGL